jgi:UPF0716 protein FxsA
LRPGTGRAETHDVRWLIPLFIVVPLVELYLLVQLSGLIDVWGTLALILVTGILGGWLAKREGLRVLREWQRAFETFTKPERGVVDGVLVLAGAALLMSPGVLTDLVGLLLLIPWTRHPVASVVRRWADRRLAHHGAHFGGLGVGGLGIGGRSPFAPHAGRASGHGPGTVVDTSGESINVDSDRPSEPPRKLPQHDD